MKPPIFGKPGLPEREFNLMLDGYLLAGTVNADDYSQLNRDQENIIQAVKRSLRRINTKIYEGTETQGV